MRRATQAVMDLTGAVGADAALECVGTEQSITTAFAARPGPVPPSGSWVSLTARTHSLPTFFRNVGWRGGPAPARRYIPDLLDRRARWGRIDPGRVLDYETDLEHIADAYQAMDNRRAIKSLVRLGSL